MTAIAISAAAVTIEALVVVLSSQGEDSSELAPQGGQLGSIGMTWRWAFER